MNEIKYRAWDCNFKKMIQVTQIQFFEDGNDIDYIMGINLEDGKKWEIKGKSSELLPFTGYYDKKGNEIYKDDILLTNYGHTQVLFDYRNGTELDSAEPMEFSQDLYEIIGNIHEDPQLLRE